jgi:hypothetical protein
MNLQNTTETTSMNVTTTMCKVICVFLERLGTLRASQVSPRKAEGGKEAAEGALLVLKPISKHQDLPRF